MILKRLALMSMLVSPSSFSYPSYSLPVKELEETSFSSVGPAQSFNQYEASKVSISVSTDKNKYFSGDNVRLNIDLFYENRSAVSDVTVKFVSEYNELDTRLFPSLSGVSAKRTRMFVELSAPDVPTPTTFFFEVTLTINGEKKKQKLTIEVERKGGEILSAETPYESEEDIIIPVMIKIDEVGLYRVTGTIFKDKEPLVRLFSQHVAKIPNTDVVRLRLYKGVVKNMRLSGRVELKDVQAKKVPMGFDDRSSSTELKDFVLDIPRLKY